MAKGTVNKVILVGRLGKDPEMKYTPSGTAVANFTMATNESIRDKEGNYTEQTEWHRVVAFGRTAEVAGEYMIKGKLVYIEGRLQTRSWDDQNGQKKYMTEIICNNLQLLGGRGDTDVKTTDSPVNEEKPEDNKDVDVAEEDDDLPF